MISAILTTTARAAVQLVVDVHPATWHNVAGAAIYDVIELWRAKLTKEGPYELITATEATSAVLPASGEGLQNDTVPAAVVPPLSGQSLKVLVGGDKLISVSFSDPDPYTLESIKQNINDQGLGILRAFSHEGRLFLATTDVGSYTSIEVQPTDGAAFLRLPTNSPSNYSIGKDPHTLLREGVQRYALVDRYGSSGFFYKTRFRSNNGDVSDFSIPFEMNAGSIVATPAGLVWCFVKLVDMRGRADANRRIVIAGGYPPVATDQYVSTGDRLVLKTDALGVAGTYLIRGARVTVAIGGTELVRDVVIPTDPNVTSVNLLDESLGSNDVFNVVHLSKDYAARRAF